VDTAGDTEIDSVLKGVVRAERLECPEDFIDAIQEAVKREHIAAMYGLAKSGDDTWSSSEVLMEKIAVKSGRLLKGGEPCLRSAAIMMINDFQRGRLPHYVFPPELKEDESDEKKKGDTAEIEGVTLDPQNLDSVERGAEVEDSKGLEAKEVTVEAEEQEEGGESKKQDSASEEEDDEADEPAIAEVGDGDWD